MNYFEFIEIIVFHSTNIKTGCTWVSLSKKWLSAKIPLGCIFLISDGPCSIYLYQDFQRLMKTALKSKALLLGTFWGIFVNVTFENKIIHSNFHFQFVENYEIEHEISHLMCYCIPNMTKIRIFDKKIYKSSNTNKVKVPLSYTVKVVIFARSYFRDLPIFNCFACF